MSELSERRISAVKGILGKRIKRVIMRVREKNIPRCQLLFAFDDGTAYEFFCSEVISPSKGVNYNDDIMGPSDGEDIIDCEIEA